jgi:hypothetical protein
MPIALNMLNENHGFYIEFQSANTETRNVTVNTSALKCIQETLIDVKYKNPKFFSDMMSRQWVIGSRRFEITINLTGSNFPRKI